MKILTIIPTYNEIGNIERLIKEIPIVFTGRKQGKSKMSKKIFFEALFNIWKIKRSQ